MFSISRTPVSSASASTSRKRLETPGKPALTYKNPNLSRIDSDLRIGSVDHLMLAVSELTRLKLNGLAKEVERLVPDRKEGKSIQKGIADIIDKLHSLDSE